MVATPLPLLPDRVLCAMLREVEITLAGDEEWLASSRKWRRINLTWEICWSVYALILGVRSIVLQEWLMTAILVALLLAQLYFSASRLRRIAQRKAEIEVMRRFLDLMGYWRYEVMDD